MACDSIDLTTGELITVATATVGTYSGGDNTIADDEVISEAIMNFDTGRDCIGESGYIIKAICRQYAPSGQTPNAKDMKLLLFDGSWTPPAASAAFDFAADGSAGDTSHCVASITFLASDMTTFPSSRSGWCHGGMTGSYLSLEGYAFKCAANETKLYGVLVNVAGSSMTVKQNTVFEIDLTFKLV
jgi:hypothetical protein